MLRNAPFADWSGLCALVSFAIAFLIFLGVLIRVLRMPRRESDTEDPENFVTAFLLKASAACDLAAEAYDLAQQQDRTKEIAAAARQAAAAWSELATKLEK